MHPGEQGRGQYLDSIFKPGPGAQVAGEGAGEHSRRPVLHFRVSQAPREVAQGAWRHRGSVGSGDFPRAPPDRGLHRARGSAHVLPAEPAPPFAQQGFSWCRGPRGAERMKAPSPRPLRDPETPEPRAAWRPPVQGGRGCSTQSSQSPRLPRLEPFPWEIPTSGLRGETASARLGSGSGTQGGVPPLARDV